jgi:hypothetical protein
VRGGRGWKVVDLTDYAWKRSVGGAFGITVYGSWFRDPEEGWRPALIIAPTDEKLIPRITLAIIPHADAYKWSPDPHIGQPRHCIEWCREFLNGLGLEDTRQNVVNLMSVIHSVFDDFLKLPPRPPRDEFVQAEATLTNTETGKTRQIEVKEGE